MGAPALKHLSVTGNPTFELSVIQLGSDDLSEALRRDRAGVTHDRYGVTIASRTWKQARIWNLNINVASQGYIESLREYFEAASFYLYPDIDNTAVKYTVYWQEDSFNPTYVAPGKYALRATFKETTIGAGTPAFLTSAGNQSIAGTLAVGGNLTVAGTFNGSVMQSGGTDLTSIFSYTGHNHSSLSISPTTVVASSYVSAPEIRIGALGSNHASVEFFTGTTELTNIASIGYYTATSSILVLGDIQFANLVKGYNLLCTGPVTANTLDVVGRIEGASWIRAAGSMLGGNFFVNQAGNVGSPFIQFSGSATDVTMPRLRYNIDVSQFEYNRNVYAPIVSGGTLRIDNISGNTGTTNPTLIFGITGSNKWLINCNRTTNDLRFDAQYGHGGSVYFPYGNVNAAGSVLVANELRVTGMTTLSTVAAQAISATTYSGITSSKGVTVLSPTSSDTITLMYTHRPILFTTAQAVVVGTSSPAVAFSCWFDSVRNTGGPDPVIHSATVANVSDGDSISSNVTVPAGNWVVLQMTSVTGTVSEFHITFNYKEV